MSNKGYVDLTIDSPEVADRKHYSAPPAINGLNQNNRILPNSFLQANLAAQNGALEPKMNAQYMNAPLQQPQAVLNQFRIPPLQAQLAQVPILQSLQPGNFQNVLERVMSGNIVQEGIDALQAHLNKSKVFQAMYQRPQVEQKYAVRGVNSARLRLSCFSNCIFVSNFPPYDRPCLPYYFTLY